MLSLPRLEKLVGLLLPPASREHVLGDLHEKCQSPRQYVTGAISVLGPVIVSRIRRTTDFQLFLMEAVSVYLSFSAAAWWLGQQAFLYEQGGFARLAIPTMVTAAGLLMCNAYTDPTRPYGSKPALQSAGSLAVAFLGQAVLFDTFSRFAIPFGILVYGSCTGFVLVSTLRLLFPPIQSGQGKVVPLGSPNLLPQNARLLLLLQRVSQVRPPRGLKAATVAASVLAFVFASTMWPGIEELLSPRHLLIVCLALLMIHQMKS